MVNNKQTGVTSEATLYFPQLGSEIPPAEA